MESLRYFYVRESAESFTSESGTHNAMFIVWNLVRKLVLATNENEKSSWQYTLDSENDDLNIINSNPTVMTDFAIAVKWKVIAASVSDNGVAHIADHYTSCLIIGTLEEFQKIMLQQPGVSTVDITMPLQDNKS